MRMFSFLLLALLLALGGCLSSDNDPTAGSSDEVQADDSLNFASIALLLTDAPLEDYDEVNFQLLGIHLLPDALSDTADAVVLFEGNQSINLLDLRHHAELFSINESVPVVDYSVVRLYTTQTVELVVYDEEQGRQVEQAKLGYAYFDLLTATPILARGGKTTYLEVDIDIEMSLLSYDATTDSLYFEPSVSVRTLQEPEEGSASETTSTDSNLPLVSVRGQLREEELICPSAQASLSACTRLVQDERTQFYNSDLSPIPADQLPLGHDVLAMGHFTPLAATGQRALHTYTLVLGQRPLLNIRSLPVREVLGEEGVGLANGRFAAWAEGARIITQHGQAIDLEDLQAPFQASILGRFSPGHLEAIALMILQDQPAIESGDEETQAVSSQVLQAEFDQVLDSELRIYQVIYQGEPLRVEASQARLVITGSGRITNSLSEHAISNADQGASMMLRGVLIEADEATENRRLVAEHLVLHRLPIQRRPQEAAR